MLPPKLFILLHNQHQQEMMQQAERARLIRTGQQAPTSLAHVSQHLLWWVGDALLAWGCVLHYEGRSPVVFEKEGYLCP
jgi:hypothetical protein